MHTRAAFKLLLIGWIILASGCASFTPVQLPTEELQRQLIAGQLVAPGDYVSVRTFDDQEFRFVIEEITPQQLKGGKIVLSIDQIHQLEKGKPTLATKAAVYSSAFAIGFFGMAAIAAFIGALLL